MKPGAVVLYIYFTSLQRGRTHTSTRLVTRLGGSLLRAVHLRLPLLSKTLMHHQNAKEWGKKEPVVLAVIAETRKVIVSTSICRQGPAHRASAANIQPLFFLVLLSERFFFC